MGHHLVNGGKYVNQFVRRVDYSAHYGQLSTRDSSNISYTNVRSRGNGLEVCNWSIVSNEYILYVSWHFRCTFAIKPFFPVRTRVHSFLLPKDSILVDIVDIWSFAFVMIAMTRHDEASRAEYIGVILLPIFVLIFQHFTPYISRQFRVNLFLTGILTWLHALHRPSESSTCIGNQVLEAT